MAKKTKKAARKSAKTPRKTARKAAPSRKKAAKAKGRGSATAPIPVNIGRGPTPREIGDAVVAHLKSGGADKEIWDRYWSRQAESIEGEGMSMMWRGRKAMAAKGDWWTSNNIMHSATVEGPYVGSTGFSVKMVIDSEERASGRRRVMEEIGVYTVNKGKVVREEFMYGPVRVISEGRSPEESSGEDVIEAELVGA